MIDHSLCKTGAARLLCVEDDTDTCEALAQLLRMSGYEVTTAGTVVDGLRLAREAAFDLIILDNWFKDSSGIELCRQIRARDPHTPILFYSAAAYETDIQQGLSAGAQAYVVKPHFEEFKRVVSQLVKIGKDDSPSLIDA
jgi:DNA-binding response OmpR family regulator